MMPARRPREAERLLVIEKDRIRDSRARELPSLLCPGDLLVVNDAATLPASLRAEDLELRLLGENRDGSFRAAVLGAGDWRTPTEHRPPPRALVRGDELDFGGLHAQVQRVLRPRLVDLRFFDEGEKLWMQLYRRGRPVQYSHLQEPLAIWDVQTRYGGRPWSAELPSAGRPLDFAMLRALAERGVELATLTHACGLSAIGDPELDAALPLPERYDIPRATSDAIARAHRVIAVGTSVVRALEASLGQPGEGETDLILDERHRLRVVHGLLTGMHDPSASHYRLLQAFAPAPLLEAAYRHAEAAGYLGHEFGDSCLIL
jgi:S-adenosylmethionine:tRNA ribosyltransferase-isomerase